jgi:hypothetical protein
MGPSAPEHNDQREHSTGVTATDGPTLTLKHKDGETKIFVPANTPMLLTCRETRATSSPARNVFIIAAKQPDGTLQGRA